MQALGFLAFTLPQGELLMPTKKPRGQKLTLEETRANQALHHRRRRIEHVNSSVKRCRMVKGPDPAVEAGRPRSGDGTLLCPAQLPGAPHALTTDGLSGINFCV